MRTAGGEISGLVITRDSDGRDCAVGVLGCCVEGCTSTGQVYPTRVPEGVFDIVVTLCRVHQDQLTSEVGEPVPFRHLEPFK